MIGAKHELITTRMSLKPSHMLTAVCKKIYLGLQIQLPALFGVPDNKGSRWNLAEVTRVIRTLFVSSKSARKKSDAVTRKVEEGHNDDAEIDEVCIYDCIAGLV